MTEGGPLSDPEFSALGKDFVLFCQIASRVPGRKYPKLREKKGLSGLPSIAFLDQTGEVLVRVSSKLRTVKGFAEIGRRAREYVRLRTLSKSGDSPASARFLKMQLEERQVDLATAQKR